MLAGAFAAVPIGVTLYLIWMIDDATRFVTESLFGVHIFGLGILMGVLVIYLIGLASRSIVGRVCASGMDRVLNRLPLVNELYKAWKQISYAPGGGEGMYARVVLVPGEASGTRLLGFTDGVSRQGVTCVFVPATPNPVVGRLHLVPDEHLSFLDVSVEDAFKMLISTGNFVPEKVVGGRHGG